MGWFDYEGQCRNGTAITGRIEAGTLEEARATLCEEMQVTLGQIRQATTPPTPRAISEEDFIFFNEQLASLASAGLALDEGLQQLARDVESSSLKSFIQAIAEDLHRGRPLDQAIAQHESRLPILYSRVIHAGIKTGQLPTTLLTLNQHLRLMRETRRILWETLSYPILVLMLAFGVLSFFMLAIVPSFIGVFTDFGGALPALTILLMRTAECYPAILVIVGGAIAVLFGVWRLLRFTPAGRRMREAMAVHTPVFRRIYRASLVSRFIRSVATCVRAGLTLPESLRLAGGVTGSPALASDAQRVAEAAERGESVLNATYLCRFIPGIFGYTLQVAIGRDTLPMALLELARTYEARAEHSQAALRLLLLPIAVVVLGGIVSVGIVGLFLPLIHLVNAVSSGGF